MIHIQSLHELLQRPNVILGLDAYGVIYNGFGIFDHSKKVIQYCDKQNIPFFVVTNNATQSISDISNQFYERGFKIAPEYIISSGCGCYLLDDIKAMIEGKKVFVYGYESSKFYPKNAGGIIVDDVNCADCIVMAASLQSDNFKVYYDCFHYLRSNPSVPVICINPDHYVMYKQQYLRVMGFYAHQMELQLNRQWVWMGKPFSLFSELVKTVLNSHSLNETDLVFCDDNPINVYQMISDLDCTGCVVTQTGVFSKYESQVSHPKMRLIPSCRLN